MRLLGRKGRPYQIAADEDHYLSCCHWSGCILHVEIRYLVSELPKSAYGVISGGAGDTPGATLAPQL